MIRKAWCHCCMCSMYEYHCACTLSTLLQLIVFTRKCSAVMFCMVFLSMMHIKSSRKTTHMPLNWRVVRISWDFTNTVRTIFHLPSELNEFTYSKNSWTGFLYMCSIPQLLDSRKRNIVLVALMLNSIGKIRSRIWLSLT